MIQSVNWLLLPQTPSLLLPKCLQQEVCDYTSFLLWWVFSPSGVYIRFLPYCIFLMTHGRKKSKGQNNLYVSFLMVTTAPLFMGMFIFFALESTCQKGWQKISSLWWYLVETFRKSLLFVSASFPFVPIRSVGCPCSRAQREGKTLRFALKKHNFVITHALTLYLLCFILSLLSR